MAKEKRRPKVAPAPQVKQPPSVGRWFFGNVFSLIRKYGGVIVFWTGMAYCTHEAAGALMVFAGRESLANLNFSFGASVSAVWTISISVAGISTGLYLKERKLHRATRKRLAKRITDLELMIDPNRSSSLLTPEGLTRQGDE